LLRI